MYQEWMSIFIHEIPAEWSPRDPEMPIGRCIYCDSSDTKLTKEHVIPEGLGGDFVIPLASCSNCANLIRAYEQPIILRKFGTLRSALKIHSKKKRSKTYKRPTTYSLFRYRGDKLSAGDTVGVEDKVDFPIGHDMPYMVSLEGTGSQPWILTGQPIARDVDGFTSSTMLNVPKNAGGHVLIEGMGHNMGATSRFVAKIAYGFAVSKIGYEKFIPYILDYIKENDAYSLPQYVGESPFFENNNKKILHRMELRIENHPAHLLPGFPAVQKRLIIADIFLFWLKPLRVVVGEIPES